jgi:hypothetical protein
VWLAVAEPRQRGLTEEDGGLIGDESEQVHARRFHRATATLPSGVVGSRTSVGASGGARGHVDTYLRRERGLRHRELLQRAV